MKISRTKFVVIFLIAGFAFLFVSNALFGTEARLFPQHGESFLETDSPTPWKSTAATILLPIKIFLIGPVLPYIEFLRQEPDTPPPFFMMGFIVYWSILALVIHFMYVKLKGRQ